MTAREPIGELVADPATPDALRERLLLVQRARAFAVEELGLPDNGSYSRYVDLDRDYVVVNVFAAPEFSLTPKTWCYPIAGCVAYRGYFSLAPARRFGERLAERGFDVAYGKVPAYSTLGRFEDPVVSTMLRRSDDGLVSLLFHELAHQRIYVPGDTAFNESFASAVATIGLDRWQGGEGEPAAVHAAGSDERTRILRHHRERLAEVYGDPALDEAGKRAQKAAIFSELAADWQAAGIKSRPPGNNAELAPIALYADFEPAFFALYRECGGMLDCFYAEVERLAALKAPERLRRMQALVP
jgi:predicted aminopeptidase